MEYNTTRPQLIISEYGRNIQNMIQYVAQLDDKNERDKGANAIVNIMQQMTPSLKDVEDFKQKLWDYIYKISNYTIDVDCPYQINKPEDRHKAERLRYPNSEIKYKCYGRSVEKFISSIRKIEDEEVKLQAITQVANLMKKNYLMWNQEAVNDNFIFEHLEKLSEGELILSPDFKLMSNSQLHTPEAPSSSKNGFKKNNQKGFKKNKPYPQANNKRNNNGR